MRFRRRPLTSTGRQRVPSTSLGQAVPRLAYRSKRSDTEVKVGRQSQREILIAAGHSARKFWLQRFGLVILLLAVLISAVNILSLSTSAKVIPVSASGQKSFLHSPEIYEAAADKLLQRSIWNQNKLTVNTDQLSRELMQQFPELDSVSVTLPLLAHRPLVYIQPAEPAVVLVTDSGEAFLLDTSGRALLMNQTVAGLRQPTLPVVADHSGIPLAADKPALPATTVSFIQQIIAQLAAKQFSVATLSLPPAARELDVQLAGQPYSIKFNLASNDPEQQVGTFLATIAQLQQQSITPSKYVDVRLDGRAYYL